MELIAVGPEPRQRWREQLPTNGQVIRLGRCPRRGWAVPWDNRIGREHADIVVLAGNKIKVQLLGTARNGIVVQGGQPKKDLILSVGEEFQIGVMMFYLTNVETEGIADE
jgi:hypothetical protein